MIKLVVFWGCVGGLLAGVLTWVLIVAGWIRLAEPRGRRRFGVLLLLLALTTAGVAATEGFSRNSFTPRVAVMRARWEELEAANRRARSRRSWFDEKARKLDECIAHGKLARKMLRAQRADAAELRRIAASLEGADRDALQKHIALLESGS